MYKNKINSIRQEMVDNFVKDLRIIKQLTLESKDKEELISKIKNNDKVNNSASYHYIKDDKFEDIIPKLDALFLEEE